LPAGSLSGSYRQTIAIVWKGKQAAEEQFRSDVSSRSIIRLAAHRYYDMLNPIQSGIIFSGPNPGDRILMTDEVYRA